MKHWEYDELFDAIKEDYDNFLKKDRGYRYAIARLVDEYYNLGKVEDLIVYTAIGEILLTHEKVFINNVNNINEKLKNFDISDLENELTKEEREKLLNKIARVLQGLEKVVIDYDPRAEK